MAEIDRVLRRAILRACLIGAPFAVLIASTGSGEAAAELPLLSESDPLAVAVEYAEDAGRAPHAKPGQTCLNCSVYSGARGAPQGPCVLFPGKAVRAAGWCTGWTDM